MKIAFANRRCLCMQNAAILALGFRGRVELFRSPLGDAGKRSIVSNSTRWYGQAMSAFTALLLRREKVGFTRMLHCSSTLWELNFLFFQPKKRKRPVTARFCSQNSTKRYATPQARPGRGLSALARGVQGVAWKPVAIAIRRAPEGVCAPICALCVEPSIRTLGTPRMSSLSQTTTFSCPGSVTGVADAVSHR